MEEDKNIEDQPAKNTAGESNAPGEKNIQPAEEITQPETNNPEPYTINPELLTQNKMEVHHHAHAAHGKKNWKTYFWEFLMLFLAVFCGFLAEYQLEHKIEKDREYQYMQGMVEDMHRDTADIEAGYTLGLQQKLMMDTLVDVLNHATLTPENVMELYTRNANSTRIVNVTFENRTAMQLKNAGGMRLIRKKEVVDSILAYLSFTETCQGISARLERMGEHRFLAGARIFNNKYYVFSGTRMMVASGIREGATLINDDPVSIAEYSNLTFARKTILNNYLLRMKEAKEKAVQLMEIIRQSYKLK